MKRSQAPASPAEIAAWARSTREQLRESRDTVAKAVHEEANTGAPFEVSLASIDAMLRLWLERGLPKDLDRFYPKTSARIRAFVARESKRR